MRSRLSLDTTLSIGRLEIAMLRAVLGVGRKFVGKVETSGEEQGGVQDHGEASSGVCINATSSIWN